MFLFRLVQRGRSPTCRGGRIFRTGLTRVIDPLQVNPLSLPLFSKAVGGDADLEMQPILRKAASTPFPPSPPHSVLQYLFEFAVCLSFLPSDNLTLISPALLSWSRSFLSQFR